MTVKLYAFTCGTVTGEFAHLMEGGEGDITVPIPVFLIEHPKVRALFDTGLAADACYFCQTLRERRLPRNMHDRQAMMASLDRLEALERGGARIFFGHDPEFWETVPQAPTPIA